MENAVLGREELSRTISRRHHIDGGFKKISRVNGFDTENSDNAKQNNYVWSMAELGDYIYIGTARNIPYSILSNQILGNVPIPPILIPKAADYAGEIWRYKKGTKKNWERVYKAPSNPMNIGFRFMINYKNALYAGALTPLSSDMLILKTTTGKDWKALEPVQGYSTGTIVEHNGKLYMGTVPLSGGSASQLFVSSDPEIDGWTKVDFGDPDKNPRGNIDLLLSFNGHLYVATARPTGFEVWRTEGAEPEKDHWILVVDQGAGDARNEHPWALGVFKEHIYIGTAIEVAIKSIDPANPLVPPKGFDVIRIGTDDIWELIVGGTPVVPTTPTTGVRGQPLSRFPSGFGDITNGYCWQIQAFGDELYLGTWSWSDLIPPFIPCIPEIVLSHLPSSSGATSEIDQLRIFFSPKIVEKVYDIGKRYIGFDLWKTKDGIRWEPVSLNGFDNPYNYGVRKLFVSAEGKLYVGTANPFQGCEVWVKSHK